MSLLVDGVAESELFSNVLATLVGIEILQERTHLVGFSHAGADSIVGHVQEDSGAVGEYPLHVVAKDWGASSCCNDGVGKLGRGLEHLSLKLAKRLFSVVFKEDGNRTVVSHLEEFVGVDKVKAQFVGKMPADGGLAGIHIAYEIDVHIGDSGDNFEIDTIEMGSNV